MSLIRRGCLPWIVAGAIILFLFAAGAAVPAIVEALR